MPSSQETDWAYSITTVPGTHTGHNSYQLVSVCKIATMQHYAMIIATIIKRSKYTCNCSGMV